MFTSGTREEQTKSNPDESDAITKSKASRYRMIFVRFIYLAMDRPDLQRVTKGASKHIGKFREHHWN